MKKLLLLFFLFILVVVSFVGGARFSQHEINKNTFESGERKILHYVDPMNPANTSKEPGIAPCGMPMEPVYADEDWPGGSGQLLSSSLGAVKANLQKQQLIGVRTEEVARGAETMKIRSLGRIAAEENKIFPLVAATDGWVGEIHESTTGSLVRKNQLMGKIRIYDYDFFTWQQRYLIEISNAAMVRRPPLAPMYEGRANQLQKIISAQQESGSLQPDIGAPVNRQSTTGMGKTPAAGSADMDNTPAEQIDSSSATIEKKVIGGRRGATLKPWRIIQHGSLLGAQEVSEQPIDKPVEQDQHMAMVMPSSETAVEAEGKHQHTAMSKTLPADKPKSNKGQKDEKDTKDSLQTSMHMQDMPPSVTAEPLASAEVIQDSTREQPVKEMDDMEAGSAMSGDHSKHMTNMAKKKRRTGPISFGVKDKFYPSQVKQELLDLGVGENQLEQLAESGVYITDVELRSPTDGLVLSRNIFPHERVTRDTECFRIADLSRVWVEADIYDFEAQYIQPGMEALISLPKMGKNYPATVSEILPRFEPSGRTLKVRMEMDNPELMFRPDMFVDVELLLNLPEAITVPSSAIIDSGKRQTVYVAVEEGIFEPREVMTGWRSNDRVEITKGLQAGEKIAVAGNFLIDSESRMKFAAARLMEGFDFAAQGSKEKTSGPMTMPQVPRNNNKSGLVIDPICAMEIDPVKAEEAGLFIEADGKTYYFCSDECAEEFHRHGLPNDQLPEENPGTDAMQKPGVHGMDHMTMSSSSSQSMPEQTSTDPVCGMTIDKEAARSNRLILEKDNQTYYFCSPECKEQFEHNHQGSTNTGGKTLAPTHMEQQP